MASSSLEEISLILRAKRGEAVAIEEVIRRYGWMVRSVVRKYFTPNGTEEDLEQEGAMAVFKAIKEYDPRKNDNVSAYISMCIDSAVKDALRMATRNKHRTLNEAVSLADFNENLDPPTPTEYVYDPVHNYIEREGLDTFYDNVANLCSDLHVRVLKYYLDGYTYDEIAALTGVNRKKVDNVMFTVKKKIKDNKNIFR